MSSTLDKLFSENSYSLETVISSNFSTSSEIRSISRAIQDRDFKQAKELIESGHDVQAEDSSYPLLYSFINSYITLKEREGLEGNEEELFDLLIDHGADIHSNEESDFNLLFLATEASLDQFVLKLLDRGAKPTVMNIELAIELENQFVVQKMLDSGIDLNAEQKEALIFTSIQYGLNDIALRLFDEKVGINSIFQQEQMTPLHYAIACENFDIVPTLLTKGAKPSLLDVDLAIEKNNEDLILHLLKSGVKLPEEKIKNYLTASIDKGFLKVVFKLFNLGIDTNTEIQPNFTAVAYAIYRNKPEIANALIEKGAKLPLGNTPLEALIFRTALRHRMDPVVKAFIEQGVDLTHTASFAIPNQPNNITISLQDAPILFYVVSSNQSEEITRLLLEKASFVDTHVAMLNQIPGELGIIYLAAVYGNISFLKTAIELDLVTEENINFVDFLGASTLDIALQGRNIDMICTLLSTGMTRLSPQDILDQPNLVNNDPKILEEIEFIMEDLDPAVSDGKGS